MRRPVLVLLALVPALLLPAPLTLPAQPALPALPVPAGAASAAALPAPRWSPAGTQVPNTVLQPTEWSPAGPQSGSGFGQSVAPAGDLDGDGYGDLLVGAPAHDGPGGVDAGAAFLYRGGANGYASTPSWTFLGAEPGENLGASVAPAGDVNGDGYLDVVVGAPYHDGSGPTVVDGGRLCVFYGSAGGLSSSPDQTFTGVVAGSHMGFAVAPAGDVNADGYADLVAGQPHIHFFVPNDGVAWILLGSPAGLNYSGYRPTGGATQEMLGYAVAGVGDVDGDGYDDVAVGAPGTTTLFPSDGSVYVYRGSSGGLLAVPLITRHGFSDSCRYGAAVAGPGDVNGDGYADVLVGAPGAVGGIVAPGTPGAVAGAAPVGYAEVIAGSSSGVPSVFWQQYGSGLGGDNFGAAVATAGDLNGDDYADFVVAGDRWPQPAVRQGRATVWLGGATAAAFDNDLLGGATGDALGASVATAGDVDGDGFSDLAIGIPGATVAQPADGEVALWRGSASKPVPAPAPFWPEVEGEAGASLGLAVAGGIDARKAGVDDLFAAAPYADAGFTDAGRIRVAESNWPWPTFAPGSVATGSQAGALLGNEMARAGDVNGDGYEDLITGSARYSTGTPDEGIAELYYGGPDGLSAGSWTFEGPEPYFNAGSDVDAGDFNGDGWTDLLVGSWSANGNAFDGSARVFRGSLAGPEPVASWVTPPVGGDTWLGYRIATGDWDADGYDDAAIGAPNASSPEFHEGRVDVYFGGPGGLDPSPTWVLEMDQASAAFGYAVGNAGDVNGDGVADLLVGARDAPGGGRAHLFFGSRSREVPHPGDARTFAPDVPTISFGAAVAGVGDIDKDGYGDFVVGAPQHPNLSLVNAGGVWLFRGSRVGGHLSPWWRHESTVAEAMFGFAITRAGDVNQDGWPDFAVGAPYPGGGSIHLFLGGGGGALHATGQTIPAPTVVPVTMGGKLPGTSFAPLVAFRSAAGRTRGRVEIQLGTQNEAWSGGVRTLHGPYDSGPAGLYGSLFPVQIAVAGLAPDLGWRWRERSVTGSPYFPHSPWRQPRSYETGQLHFRTAGTNVAVEPGPPAPRPGPRLVAIEPSPFREAARIRFRLARAAAARVVIHDVRGRAVRRLPASWRAAGEGAVAFDGRDDAGTPLAAGIYFVSLTADGGGDVRKLVRLP
jgi:hypothetical protein